MRQRFLTAVRDVVAAAIASALLVGSPAVAQEAFSSIGSGYVLSEGADVVVGEVTSRRRIEAGGGVASMVLLSAEPVGTFDGVQARLTVLNLTVDCADFSASLQSQEFYDGNAELVFRTRLDEAQPLTDRRYTAFANIVCRDSNGSTRGHLQGLAAGFADGQEFLRLGSRHLAAGGSG